MTDAPLVPVWAFSMIDSNGEPISGAKLYCYEAGSVSTSQLCYQDSALTTAHTNPIVADSAGRFATPVYAQNLQYKFVLKDANDVTLQTVDPWSPNGSADFVVYNQGDAGAVTRTVKSRLQDVVHLDDFGATASDSDDDAATNVTAFTNAIASGAGTIILSAGTYRVNDTITPAIYQVIRGQGKTSTAVKMVDSVTGKPVWGIESHHIILEHFQTGWVSATQTTAHSVGIRFMDTAAGVNALCGWGAFRNLRIENTYTGIDVDKSGTMAGCFSWHFEDLYIREFEESGIYNHPTGAGNSGDVYENVYIANARAGTQETGTMLDIREASSVTFNLVNLEANRLDADKPLLYLQNVTGFSINGLHIEDVDMDNHTGSDNGIIELSDKCIGVFNGIRVDGVTIPATADRLALFKIKTTNTAAAYQPRVTVDGVSIIDTTGIVPATAWNLVQTNANLSSANGARLSVRNIHTEKAFDGTVYNGDADFLWFYASDGGDTMLMDTLRVDTEIELGDGGPKVLWGSGSPEGSVTAPIGSTFHRDDGGAGTAYYTKESGSGNTGWSAALTSGVNQLTQHGTTHTSVSSGTQISWTSIPAGVQYIRLVYFNHSASLGEDLVLTMGDSGGEETSGYYGTTSNGPSANVDWDSASNVAAEITRGAGASDVVHGCIELTLMTSNEWQISALSNTKGGSQHNASGYKALSAELTSVFLQMESGASFDGGGDYILYYQ